MNKITRSLKSSIAVKNPFQTPVGRYVEHLTETNSQQEIKDGLPHLYHEMSNSDNGPKHGAKALRFRMVRTSPLSFKILLNTLTVLEGCVKNCGKRFHQHVVKKSFLADFAHLILPKYSPAEEVRQRAVTLLRSWLDMFSGQPELMELERFYQELQADVSLNMPSSAPIRRAGSDSSLTAAGGFGSASSYTPAREPSRTTALGGHRHSHTATRNRPGSVAYPTAPQYSPNAGYYAGGMYYPQAYGGDGAAFAGGVPMSLPPGADSPQSESSSLPLSPEKVAKLSREIDTVLENANLLGELIASNNPGQESADEFQLMSDMHDQCKKMQERIMTLLPKLSQDNEGSMGKLLAANDKLGEVFILFDSYVVERDRLSNRRADNSPQVVHRGGPGSGAGARSPDDAPDAANVRPPSFADLPPAYPKVASTTSALSFPKPAPPPEPEVDLWGRDEDTHGGVAGTSSALQGLNLGGSASRNAGGAGSSTANDLLLDLDPLNAPPGSQPPAPIGVGAFGMPQQQPPPGMYPQMYPPPMAPTGALSNNPFAAAAAASTSGYTPTGYGSYAPPSAYAPPISGSLYGSQAPFGGPLRPSTGMYNSALNNPPPPLPATETLSSGARAPGAAGSTAPAPAIGSGAAGVGVPGMYSNSAWLKFEEEGGVGALTGSSSARAAGASASGGPFTSGSAEPSTTYPSLVSIPSSSAASRPGGAPGAARPANSIPEGDNPLISF